MSTVTCKSPFGQGEKTIFTTQSSLKSKAVQALVCLQGMLCTTPLRTGIGF